MACEVMTYNFERIGISLLIYLFSLCFGADITLIWKWVFSIFYTLDGIGIVISLFDKSYYLHFFCLSHHPPWQRLRIKLYLSTVMLHFRTWREKDKFPSDVKLQKRSGEKSLNTPSVGIQIDHWKRAYQSVWDHVEFAVRFERRRSQTRQ